MVSAVGFRYIDSVVGDNAGYHPQFRDARGNFEGETYRNTIGGDTDAIEALASAFSTSGGANFVGLDVNGKGDYSGDPDIENQISKARSEDDIEKHRAIVLDLQRYLGKMQYMCGIPAAPVVWNCNGRLYVIITHSEECSLRTAAGITTSGSTPACRR